MLDDQRIMNDLNNATRRYSEAKRKSIDLAMYPESRARALTPPINRNRKVDSACLDTVGGDDI